MPVEAGEEVNFEQLLAEWANEGNGQCLGSDVEHIVFHIGRYSLSTTAKAWVKHHHKLHTPSSFSCPQQTSTGHAGHSTFVPMLVEGDALWVVDDGECPQVQQHVPEHIQRGAVMVRPSRAEQNEQSTFWSRAIGRFLIHLLSGQEC